jgi:formate hydrogenlyase transcriptional activator
MEVLREVRERDRELPIFMITAYGSTQVAVDALKAGATDYFQKPWENDKLLLEIDRIIAKHRLERENTQLKRTLKQRYSFPNIVGKSERMVRILDLVTQVAPSRSTILITGETGTGKELIASAVHEASPRRDKPMVKLNCAAISAGLVESELFGHVKGAFTGATDKHVGRFQLADGGTLFLDEVSELPLDTQVKLLRVLQEREFEPVGSAKTQRVDVRVIAATNRRLEDEVAAGRFRSDLFYRLNVFPVEVPPLRARREDIPALVDHFIERYARKFGRRVSGLVPGVRETLLGYDWPGNVRELQNVIERAMISSPGDKLSIDWELRGHARAGAAVAVKGAAPAVALASAEASRPAGTINGDTLVEVERQHIIAVLKRTAGIIEGPKGAAKLLDMKPSTARYRMKKLGIRKSDYVD